MIPLKFAYLLGDIVFFIPWIFFFLRRKDLQKEMLIMSILVGIGSVITSYFWWTVDWWHPITITATRVGIEDFLLGFSNGGIAAVAYEYFFEKSEYGFTDKHSKEEGAAVTFATVLLLSVGFWGLRLTSFWACVIAMICGILLLFYFRRDLVINGIFSGIFMVLISLPAYLIPEFLSPGVLNASWYYHLLSGVRFLGIPIEDLIFYFLMGIWAGPFYELAFAKKTRKMAQKKDAQK